MDRLRIRVSRPVTLVVEEPPALVVVAKVPTFRQLKRRFPVDGLMFSCILHCTALALLPIIAPPLRLVDIRHQAITLIAPDDAAGHLYLPSLGDSGSQAGSSSSFGPEGGAKHAKGATVRRAAMAKYEGPQVILSDPPDATNELQTIRRPDVVVPMKIKAPVQLRSMVQIAAPNITAPKVAPDILAHPTPLLPQKAEITVNAPAPENEPVLVVRQSPAPPKVVEVPPPSVVPSKSAAPELTQLSGNAPVLMKSVIAVNAVEPVPVMNAVIPDAEISGRFSVAPSSMNVSGPTSDSSGPNGKLEPAAQGGSGGTGSSPLGSAGTGGGASDRGGPGAGSSGSGSGAGLAGNGNGSRIGSGIFDGGGTGTGSSAGAGTGAGSGSGDPGAGRGGVGDGRSMRGLSIAAGKGGGGSTGSSIAAGHSYHLTIIAAGSNGGASRDLGIFAKDETVYTISLSMKDAGGGPDWPMQYALSTRPQSRVVLTPPYPVKQVQATIKELFRDTGPVFIAGEIDEVGQLRSLHPARASDTRAAAAIAALSQWQFSPAKLDGKAVPAKVVIGVKFVKVG